MSKPRKGKAQRLLARQQWGQFRTIRDSLVTDNLRAGPGPKPVKFAQLGDLGRFGARAKVSQLIIRNDPVNMRSRANKKYGMADSEYYKEPLDVTGGERTECQVRVGTSPSRLVVTDKIGGDGKRIVFRVPEQGKYRPVGSPDSIPKDGGK